MGSARGTGFAHKWLGPFLEIGEDPKLKENINYVLGLSCFQAGNFEDADVYLKDAIALNGSNKESAETILELCILSASIEDRSEIVKYANLGEEQWHKDKYSWYEDIYNRGSIEEHILKDKEFLEVKELYITSKVNCEKAKIFGMLTEEEIEEIELEGDKIYYTTLQRLMGISSNQVMVTDEPSKGNEKKSKVKVKKDYGNYLDALNELVGLEVIKKEVKDLVDFVQVNMKRSSKGLPEVQIGLHSVFYGPPGTGKTSVARVIGRAFKEIGILEKGHIIETDRSDLVAGYLGQTAIKTKEILESALDGVLFIDEAYTLTNDDQYGQEAIDTILKFMEDHRDRIIVIAAGYEDEMKKFLDSNPGLKSRFNKEFNFPNYDIDELIQITDNLFKKSHFKLSKEAMNKIEEILKVEIEANVRNFGNARFVRNLYEQIVQRQFSRVSGLESPSKKELCLVTPEDIIKKQVAS